MTFSSISSVRSKLWKDIPGAQDLQRQADIAPAEEKINLLAQLASYRSQKIFQASRPNHIDTVITDLEIERQALFNLNQACKLNDACQIKNQLYNLPENVRNFLLWAIWIVDSLEAKPIHGLGHSTDRLNDNPMIIGSANAKKVIYTNGGSLVEQLLNYTTDTLALKYQEKIVANLPDKKHPEQKKLAKMQLAKDLAQYDQMIALKPFIATTEQRSTFENYLSPRVRCWLNTANELYESRGAHYRNNRATFSVYAPHAQNVQCLLTAFGRVERVVDMQKQADGTWRASIDQVNPGATYLYRVKDCHGKITDRIDPFSFGNMHISETDTIHSVIVDRNRFVWDDSEWLVKRAKTEPLKQPLSIYEVHIKSWAEGKKNLREIAHQLAAHCKEMGFTHVELYGIMEHFWEKARGYQVTNFFAPYHDAGSYEDMKYFVNYMHQQGLGVIVDWIPAHYDHGRVDSRHLNSSMYQFDGTDLFGNEKSNWETVYVDYSKPEARRLVEASAFWWLQEFHFDGLRVDAVSQLVKRNNNDVQAGIEFLGQLNDKIHALCPGVLTIAEATDWDPRICQPTKERGFGFDLNWSVGASHNLHNYLKTPENERSKPEHHKHKLESIFEEGQRTHEKKISTHSHDDVDGGHNNHDKTLYNLGKNHSNEAERLRDIRNFFAWQIFSPNWGHLIHMGDEFAQPESWYARFQKDQSSMQRECANIPSHGYQKEFVKDAIHYYKSEKAFWEQGGANSELVCSHGPNKVIAYARDKNIVIHNFSNTGYQSYDIPIGPRFKEIAQMQERLNSDAVRYGGSGQYLNGNVTILHDGNGSKLNVKMPPRSTLVFSNVNQKTINPEIIQSLTSKEIVIKCKVPPGHNDLFIRGSGNGLTWEKGISLTRIGEDTWVYRSNSDLQDMEYKILLNDIIWQDGENSRVSEGKINKTHPQFTLPASATTSISNTPPLPHTTRIAVKFDTFGNKLFIRETPDDSTSQVLVLQPFSHNPAKEIVIKCKVPPGHNNLFIRGSGNGLTWEKGISLIRIDEDTWVYRSNSDLQDMEYKILFNDVIWQEGKNSRVSEGKINKIHPQFTLPASVTTFNVPSRTGSFNIPPPPLRPSPLRLRNYSISNVPPLPRTTRITVKLDTGFGKNKLFIRGNGPGMSWDKGIELRNEGNDIWFFETQANFENFEYKILLNDQRWEDCGNHITNFGKKEEIIPHFN